MIVAVLLALQAAAPLVAGKPPADAQPLQTLRAPIDWEALPPLNYRDPPAITPAMQAFVAGEVAAGQCAPPRGPEGHYWIKLDVAVLVDGDGHVLRVMPHAINCPTVEQFGAGLALSFARENLLPRTQRDDRWFRASFVFTRP